MIRLGLVVLIPGLFVCVFSTPDAARCRGFTYKQNAGGFLKYQEMPLTFDDAKQRCAVEGGILASPINDGIKDAMIDIMKISNLNKAVFTGFSAKSNYRGIFFSIRGIRLSNIPHNWAPDEPDNSDDKENCIIMLPDGTMADVKCNATFPYFCFMKESRAKTVNVCGANDKDGPDYALDETTGSCYKVHAKRLPYNDAAKTCEEEGGHLLIINGDTEAQAIKKLLSECEPSLFGYTAMIGIRLSEKSGNWITVQGETIEEVGYVNWAPGEPNNVAKNQNCVGVYRSGMWDDIWCEANYAFICEKTPEIVFC